MMSQLSKLMKLKYKYLKSRTSLFQKIKELFNFASKISFLEVIMKDVHRFEYIFVGPKKIFLSVGG